MNFELSWPGTFLTQTAKSTSKLTFIYRSAVTVRKLIGSILVAFLSSGASEKTKKIEILTILGELLSFDEYQRKLIGLEHQKISDEYLQPKLAELWTAFLMGQSGK